MKKILKAGLADQTIDIFVMDSSSAVGAGLTGLVFNSASLVCYYRRGATGSATQLTLATQTVGGAHSDGGFVEISSSNMPGMYRMDLSDAIVAAGVTTVTLMLKGAANMAPVLIELQLVSIDLDDAVRFGITALPNAAAEASGGLPTLSAAQASNGTIQANVHRWLTGTPSALISGRVDANMQALADNVLTAAKFASGAFDAVWTVTTRELTAFNAAFKSGYALSSAGVQAIWDALTSALTTVGSIGKLLVDNINATISSRSSHSAADVWASGTRTLTAATNITSTGGTTVPQTGDAFARLGAPAGASVSADIAAVNAKTTNLPASPAAVGSAMTLTSGERDSVADALLDRTDAIETGITPRKQMRLSVAAHGGKTNGMGTATGKIRNVADTKDRVSATLDADGNRSAVTLDLT